MIKASSTVTFVCMKNTALDKSLITNIYIALGFASCYILPSNLISRCSAATYVNSYKLAAVL